MDMAKTGALLKELRREKALTQEQLAELLGVSGRTVSRWETGRTLPDFDLLIQLADYYAVELKEILTGERSQKPMAQDTKGTLKDIADYNNREKQRLAKRMCSFFIAGALSFLAYLALNLLGPSETFINGALSGFCLGLSFGVMLLGILYTSGCMAKFRAAKQRLLHRR